MNSRMRRLGYCKSRGFIAPGKLEPTNVEMRFLFLTRANYNTRIVSIDGLYLFFIQRLTEPAMSVSALHIYEQLTDAPDDKARARIIAEAIGQLEDRYPQLREVATQPQLRETELRLQKEIKEVEARLSKEIHLLDLKIAENTSKIAETKAELVRWVVGVGLLQTTLISGILLRVAHLI